MYRPSTKEIDDKMSTISASSSITSSITTAPRNEAPAQNTSNNTSSRLEVSTSQPANGNSSSATVQTSDNVSVNNRASAISTNDSVNRVLTDIMGPRNDSGNSAAGSLEIRANDGSQPVPADDPAAPYRSAEKVPLEGYNAEKLANLEHKTPKYLFGRVAQGFKLDSVQGDKAKAEELLKAMLPDLKKAGLEVVGVEGDRIQVKTELGYEWVDVVRGAGSNDPGWHWGSEGKGTPQPTKSSKEWAALTGQTGQGAGGAIEPAMSGGAGGGGAAPAGGGAAPAGGGGAVSGPKFTPLGNQIDQSKVLPVLEKYSVNDIEKAVQDPEIQNAYPGAKVIPHPKRLDKIQFPNGAVVDCVVAAGAPDAKWGWMPEN